MRNLNGYSDLFQVVLLFLLLISFTGISNGQIIWKKLDNLKYFQPEDIAATSSGNLYISVFGQNKILESTDSGKSWKNIVFDGFKYLSFDFQKNLFIDHKDSLVEFFYEFGIPVPRYFDGHELHTDSLSKTKDALLGNRNIKYNQNNEYFYINSRELRKYRRPFYDSDIIFNNGEMIKNYFVFNDSINYIITEKGTFRIYKVNTKTKDIRLIVSALITNNPELVLFNRSGKVLIPTVSGLYRSSDEGISSEIITFDNQVDPQTNITDLRRLKNSNIIMRAESNYYYSNDEGDHWIKLSAFNNSCPDYSKIVKLEAIDTQLAVMIIKDKCDLEKTVVLTSEFNAWRDLVVDISILDMGNVIKSKANRLFASDHLCEIVYSDDESASWSPYFIQNKNILSIVSTKSKVLFAVTKEKRELFRSNDNGDNWIYLSDRIGIPNIEIIAVKPIIGDTIILIGGIKDFGTVNYRDTFEFLSLNNGDKWDILPKNTNNYIYNLAWDRNTKIFSFFSQLNTVYSSEDLGFTWKIDNLFDDFDRINSIYFGKNNLIILYGRYKGEFNVYLSYDRKNFIPCNGNYFKVDVATLVEIKDEFIVALLGFTGIFLSKDGGFNWEDITSGISIFDELATAINSIFIDDRNQAYLSVQNDGLYKSNEPLVKAINDQDSNFDFYTYPNPFVNDFIIKCNSCKNSPYYELEVYNNLGVLITRVKLFNEINQLHCLSELPSGIYIYQLKKSGNIKDAGKLVKL